MLEPNSFTSLCRFVQSLDGELGSGMRFAIWARFTLKLCFCPNYKSQTRPQSSSVLLPNCLSSEKSIAQNPLFLENRIMVSTLFKSLERVFLHSWGVLLFALLCFMCFEQAMKKHQIEYTKLALKRDLLLQEKIQATQLHAALLLQINSESDPAWIELILMQTLGLTPEGKIKVFFK